ncbi:MAG: hypothetical protein GX876_07825 [Bacteroidales bacterium]|nr:hypothetical protein [Bacteroidales bacterium]
MLVTWKWRVNKTDDLSGVYQKYKGSTDECRQIDGNKKILIISIIWRSCRGRQVPVEETAEPV